jgi:hypothetical protein
MNTVVVTGPGQIVGTVQKGGYTYNQWGFSVVVNGEAGVAYVYALTDVSYQDIVDYLVNGLENGDITLGGISSTDPGTGDDSRVADGTTDDTDQDDDRGDDDDGGDGGLASGGGGDDWGDSA